MEKMYLFPVSQRYFAFHGFTSKIVRGWVRWHMSVIPPSWAVEIGGSKFETSLGSN
jgi:hypothetical protein